MTSRAPMDDKLDEVLAEIEAARREPSLPQEESRSARRLVWPPESLGQGRWVPSRTAVMLILVCALLALGIFGVRVLLSSSKEVTARPSPSRVSISGSAQTTGAVQPSGASLAGSTASRWSIHVVGAVKRPGVVSVSPEARVADAVAAAGGLAADADTDGLNLARKLADGEQVHVPKPGEKWSAPPDAGGAAAAGAAPSGASGGETSAGSGGAVNLNTATLEQLDELPGVGPVMAQRILDWRKEHGRFSSIEELGEVSGIGDKTLAKLKPKITV